MMDPLRLAAREGEVFLFALAAMIAYQILTRRISLGGLLLRKEGSGSTMSPERVQLLLATIMMCADYLNRAVTAPTGSLPDPGAKMLMVFGASSGIYAGIKAINTFRS